MAFRDGIWLLGVECRARLGVPDWERKRRQKIHLDIGLELPLAKAGRSDDVQDTADYWELEKRVRATVEKGEFKLVERLAAVAAETALAADRRIRSVRVRVRKRPSVMPRTREVVVEIERR